LSVSSATNIAYVLFGSTGVFPNSVFADDLSVTFNSTSVVPLPGALPLFASGLVGLGLLSRRRKKAAA
jgi:hypothetical protein